jgi:hypothetical protein
MAADATSIQQRPNVWQPKNRDASQDCLWETPEEETREQAN